MKNTYPCYFFKQICYVYFSGDKMIIKENSTKQKLSGSYYTPEKLASKMIDLVMTDFYPKHILEPSCGDGVFLRELLSKYSNDRFFSVTGIEINQKEAEKACLYTAKHNHVHIIQDDFFQYYSSNKEISRFDLILGNPPYIRYQYLTDEERSKITDILAEHDMKMNRLSNVWVAFVVSAVHMLMDNGKLAFVLPADLLWVKYAEELRVFLSKTLSKITIISFQELIFPDIEQEIILFIAEKGKEPCKIQLIELNNLGELDLLKIKESDYSVITNPKEKWSRYYITLEENMFLNSILEDKRFQKLSDVAEISVGVTTGYNKFFTVNKETVDAYHLQDIAYPVFCKGIICSGICYTKKDWQYNISQNKTAYILKFPEHEPALLPVSYQEYIMQGEKEQIHTRYKCSLRNPWYSLHSMWVSDGFITRRNYRYVKLLLNDCDAISTDTINRVVFRESVSREGILLLFYNSITFAFTEICGRKYGGGVLEILPGEAREILIPKFNHIPKPVIQKLFVQIDHMLRNGDAIEDILDLTDQEILIKYLNIPESYCEKARFIWKKLQKKRLKE